MRSPQQPGHHSDVLDTCQKYRGDADRDEGSEAIPAR